MLIRPTLFLHAYGHPAVSTDKRTTKTKTNTHDDDKTKAGTMTLDENSLGLHGLSLQFRGIIVLITINCSMLRLESMVLVCC